MPNLEEVDDEAPPRRGRKPARGRGRGGKHGRTVVTTRQEIVDDGDEDGNSSDDGPNVDSSAPIFSKVDVEENGIYKIRVFRKDPDEGFLGYLEDPDTATEQDIEKKWGGSLYRCEAVNSKGAIIRVKNVRVAGDPKFIGTVAANEWRKMNGMPPLSAVGNTTAGMGMNEMLAFMAEKEEIRRRTEAELRAEARKHELELEERRRRLELEAEDKRRRDEAERDERRRRDQLEAEARQQQFFQTMMAITKSSSDQAIEIAKAQNAGNKNSLGEAIQMIATIKDVFGGDGAGDEPTDPLTMLAKHGPEWLKAAGDAIGGAVSEIRSGGTPGTPTQTQQQIAAPPRALGALEPKIMTLAEKLIAKGQDPEKFFDVALDQLTAMVDGKPQPPATVKPPRAPAPQSPQAGSIENSQPLPRKKNGEVKRSNRAQVGIKKNGTVLVAFTDAKPPAEAEVKASEVASAPAG